MRATWRGAIASRSKLIDVSKLNEMNEEGMLGAIKSSETKK